MEKCNCGKEFNTAKSLNSHARFCEKYVKKEVVKNTEYVCECGKTFEKSQSLCAHYSRCIIHRNGILPSKKGAWNVSDESRKKGGITYSENIKAGKIIPSFKGKKHTIETREKISEKMKENNNGLIKTKFMSIFSAYSNKDVNVQGSWEYKFASRLNEMKISWEKDKRYFFYYHIDGIKKKYYPDFFLPDRNLFVEIKGYWFKSNDGRIDDKRKMKLVIDQNSSVNFLILDNVKDIENYS